MSELREMLEAEGIRVVEAPDLFTRGYGEWATEQPMEGEGVKQMEKELEPIFEGEIPVILGSDHEWPIGKALGFHDPTTGKVHIDLEFNATVSEDLSWIREVIKTTSLSFVGIASDPPGPVPEEKREVDVHFTTEVLPRATFHNAGLTDPGGITYKISDGVPEPIFVTVYADPKNNTTWAVILDRKFKTDGLKTHRETLLELGFKLSLDLSHFGFGVRKTELLMCLDEFSKSKDDILPIVNELWKR